MRGMPSVIQELVKRRVIQQWISGVSRDKIPADNNIGAGIVSSIINGYKTQIENSDLGSVRDSCRGKKTRIIFKRISFAY